MKALSQEALRDAFTDAAGERLSMPELSHRDKARGRFAGIGARISALGRTTGVNAIDRASAALKTSVQGAEAGVSIAPFALMGRDDSPHQINITLAALKDTRTRFGIAYSYELPWNPLHLEDLGLDPCTLDKARKDLSNRLGEARSALFRVCDELISYQLEALSETPWDEDTLHAARACAIPLPEGVSRVSENDEMPLEQGVRAILSLVDKEKKRLEAAEQSGRPGAAAARFNLEQRTFRARDSLAVLADVESESAYPCYGPKAIDIAVKTASWTHLRHRIGIGMTADLFPIILGFQPEGKDVSRGELQRWQAKLEYAMVSESAGLTIGAGIGHWRDTFKDPFHVLVSPSASAIAVIGSLTREPLFTPDGRLNLMNDRLPPRLAVGADLTVDIALVRPPTQVTALHKLTGTLFLDFLFTDKLAFRVGVTVSADTQVRAAKPDADPPVTERRDLQWTFPIGLITVLKM
ncbi:hypothetical protein A7982_12029 [Minicystis rosea]|nr:hypothetical protein A7982_12029 [Minicystis rosea]